MPADGRALRLVSCCSEPGSNDRDSKTGGQSHPDAESYGLWDPGSDRRDPSTLRVEEGAVAEYRAGDVEQTVGH